MPARYSESGRRERHFYKTKREANEAAEKFREQRDQFGDQARAIAPSLAEDAHAASLLLKPLGIGLLDAVQRFVEMEHARRNSEEVGPAFEAFIRTKEGRSERQLHAYELAQGHFVSEFGARTLASITGPELVDHVENVTGGPSSFNHRVRLIKSFWRWCAREPRAWCKASVIEHLEPKETSRGEITVLKAEECERLLRTAEEHFPDCATAFALALFTGMRQAEIERLSPADFRDEGISVPAVAAPKIKSRRFIEMTPALKAWLKAYPVRETVLPSNWTRKEKAVRRLAGWRVWSDLVPALNLKPPVHAEPPDDFPVWPANVLRHTHATVALAAGNSVESLIFEFGHTGGTSTLKAHYAGVMPKKEALKILKIRPRKK